MDEIIKAVAEVIKTLSEAIEKLYRDFVVRDLLGFVLPGALFLFLLSYSIKDCYPDFFHWLNGIADKITQSSEPKWIEILVLLGIAYLTGWTLQSVHYGTANLICLLPFCKKRKSRTNNTIDISQLVDESCYLTTRWALDPDKAILIKLKTKEGLKILRQESASYTERVTALMLMAGNIATGSVLLLLAILIMQLCGGIGFWISSGIVTIVVILALYFEHWRLWKARNLRHRVYVEVAHHLEEETEKNNKLKNSKSDESQTEGSE